MKRSHLIYRAKLQKTDCQIVLGVCDQEYKWKCEKGFGKNFSGWRKRLFNESQKERKA